MLYHPKLIRAVIEAAIDVTNNADDNGCSDDLTVTSKSAVERLQQAVRALPNDPTLFIGMHTYENGVSLYPFLGSAAQQVTVAGFKAWLGDSFDERRQDDGENAEVTAFTADQIEDITPVLTAPEAKTCRRCGSRVDGDYCQDFACPYSEWPQQVEVSDLTEMSAAKVEQMYGVTRRS